MKPPINAGPATIDHLRALVREMRQDADRASGMSPASKVSFAGIVVSGWADRLERIVSEPGSVRIGAFDYVENSDGSITRIDWRGEPSRARVDEILSRERLFEALTEALTRADAAEQALRDIAAHVHALFPMDSPGPTPGHEASFIIHTTNHMNDSRRAASLQEIQRRDGVGAAEAMRRQAFNQAHGLRAEDK